MKPEPEISLKAWIILGSICCAMAVWGMPAIKAWIKVHIPPAMHARAPESPEAEASRRYAAVIAACLNGQLITDGVHFFECRRK